ncbi:hypothetical protein M405DRAFT_933200 [Rhizopogon salebrosus TDB-379]|nr:hypothetical protein M405DRAFT_933200 [Rhizopogon salebrosus TDB-379]
MASWSDPGRRREEVAAMNLETGELVRAVRAELLAGGLEIEESETYVEEYYEDLTFRKGFDHMQQQSMAETFKRSWAAWSVAEDALKEDPSMFGAQSFGLIALGRMLEILKASGLM